MKKVILKPYHGKIFLKNGVFDIDQTHNPFFGLREKIKKYGVNICTYDISDQKPDLFIYCDVPYPWEIKPLFYMLLNRKKNILFTFESPLLNPFNQIKFFHLFFRKIYSWNDLIIDNKKIFKFYFPQNLERIPIDFKNLKKKKLIIMINRGVPKYYKFFSILARSNYFLRERIARYLSYKHEKDFDLFGRGWNIKSLSYKGVLNKDKLVKMSEYKFCICLENAISDGYITEKIFDCFLAGCVPIYLGPKNIDEYIPRNTYIDFSNFSNLDNLVKYLKHIPKNRYNKYLQAINLFLRDKETFDRWSRESFMKKILQELK